MFSRTAITLYHWAIRLAQPFSAKARAWVQGRKGWQEMPELAALDADRPTLWLHCASLGEFEQGRPVLEALRQEHPALQVVLTFYSPSGYEVRKDYPHAEAVLYLPEDSPANAQQFLQLVQPNLALFVKYDLWPSYIEALSALRIPTILISALFEQGRGMLRKRAWPFYSKLLAQLQHIFVQNQPSLQLLKAQAPKLPATLAGDTRFDRVLAIAQAAEELPAVKRWVGKRVCMVAGSTWPPDEEMLSAAIDPWLEATGPSQQLLNDPHTAEGLGFCLIIAPHEVHERDLKRIEAGFMRYGVQRLSQLPKDPQAPPAPILLVDSIGLLSRIYRYGHLAWLGGGYGKGIHNTLEAAVWGMPIFFGSNYKRFPEAVAMVQQQLAFEVSNATSARRQLEHLLMNPEERHALAERMRAFVQQGGGATVTIVEHIRQQGWLS